ncbi:MAG: hypothetical protein ABIH17_10625, partial [Pseudomonadota bacterium]
AASADMHSNWSGRFSNHDLAWTCTFHSMRPTWNPLRKLAFGWVLYWTTESTISGLVPKMARRP